VVKPKDEKLIKGISRREYMKKYDKERYRKNRTSEIARAIKWYEDNKEEILKRKHVYYMKNKERIKANKNKWYNKNKKVLAKKARVYQVQNPELRRSTILKNKYGITLKEYNVILKKQKYKCAICNITNTSSKRKYNKYLSVDHCHKTNKVRGLLCDFCNNGLGRFKDSVRFLLKAIKYLRRLK